MKKRWVEGGTPLPLPAWGQFLHPVHTYFIDTGWGGGGGVSAQISRERTAVVSGAIKRFSALFQERTIGFF